MNELNVEIARLMGWRETSPSTPSYQIPPGEQLATNVPRYDSDPAAALGLLEHVASMDLAGSAQVSHNRSWVCAITYRKPPYIVTGESDTLPKAIALACRDALLALRGDDGAADKANEEVGS